MKIYLDRIHPTNTNLQWVERWGSFRWEVKPCIGNELEPLPESVKERKTISEQLMNGYSYNALPATQDAYRACANWQGAKARRVREQKRNGIDTEKFKELYALELELQKIKIQKQEDRCKILGKNKPKQRVDRGLSLEKRAPASKYTPELIALNKEIATARKCALNTKSLVKTRHWNLRAAALAKKKDKMLIKLAKV